MMNDRGSLEIVYITWYISVGLNLSRMRGICSGLSWRVGRSGLNNDDGKERVFL